MAVLGLAAPKRGLRRTENPRVGGSIPPLATTPNWSVRVTWVTFYSGPRCQDSCRLDLSRVHGRARGDMR
jgi:hypothetical protein